MKNTHSLLAMCCLWVGCGGQAHGVAPGQDGGSAPPTPTTIMVAVRPERAEIPPGGSVQFTAMINGSDNTSVTWTVEGSGTIDADGLYHAPATEGMYRVRATSVADPNASDEAMADVRTIADCDGLGSTPGWQNITPPYLASQAGQYGAEGLLVDPINPRRVYVGSDHGGLFRSEDCGATWTEIALGQNGPTAIRGGATWSMVIDPVDSRILYSVSGYGAQGLWKSTDSGDSWVNLFPEGSEVEQSTFENFASIVAMDPTDHLHLVVAFHNDCLGQYAPHCQAESHDGGATWRLFTVPGGGEGSGPIIINPTTWMFGTYDGLMRTDDSGATWDNVMHEHNAHYEMYTDHNGRYYVGTQGGIYTSSGDASVWTVIENSGWNLQGLWGDGVHIFASQQFDPGMYWMASEDDPLHWTELPKDDADWGGYWLAADPVNHILYSAEMGDGLWRYIDR